MHICQKGVQWPHPYGRARTPVTESARATVVVGGVAYDGGSEENVLQNE